MKTIIYTFFGILGAMLLGVLTAIGGGIGAGSSIVIDSICHNLLLASIAGGALAAFAFHFVCKQYDKFMTTVIAKEGKPAPKRLLTTANKHLWGAFSYLISTIIGVNLAHAIAGPSWFTRIAIIISGLLGIVGLVAMLGFKIWQPFDQKAKEEEKEEVTEPNKNTE